MAINENNAYSLTNKLSFPRMVGSNGEKKARDIIIEEFKKIGYEKIHREQFKTSLYSWNIGRWAFMAIGLYLILVSISFYFSYWITLLLSLIFFIIGLKGLSLLNPKGINLSKSAKNNFETENIHVKLKSSNSKAIITFIAHYDSKGQIFPKKLLIIIYLISIFGYAIMDVSFLFLSIIRIFFVFSNQIFLNILLIICIIITSIGSLNFFNRTINTSPGASDDAAGIGVLIEISKYFKKNRLNNVDLIFLATSSEELNLGGAKTFIKNHKEEFLPKSSFFINLDSLGGKEPFRLITSYGIPKKICSPILKKYFLDSAKELDILIKEIYMAEGAWSDIMPIIREGFEGIWLDGSSGLIKYIHTKKDVISLVSKDSLKKCMILSINVITKIDNQFQ